MSNATDLLKSIILNDNNALEHASDKDEGGPEDGDEDKQSQTDSHKIQDAMTLMTREELIKKHFGTATGRTGQGHKQNMDLNSEDQDD